MEALDEEKNALLDYIEELQAKGSSSVGEEDNPTSVVHKFLQDISQLKAAHEQQICEMQQMLQDQQRASLHQTGVSSAIHAGAETFGKEKIIVLDL